MLRLIIFFMLFFCVFHVQEIYGQASAKKVWGEVRDAQSYEPVSIANVSTNQKGTYTDLDGHFSLMLSSEDTVLISHINYYPYQAVMREMQGDTLHVFLIPRVNTMQELIIQGLPSEERFKRDMLSLEVAPTTEEQQARSNVSFARYYFLSGYVPQMNSDDNHDMYVAGPQDVTFFSSGPNGGLLRAFKNVNRSQQLLQPLRMNTSTADTVWQRMELQVEKDSTTLAQDSLLNKEK